MIPEIAWREISEKDFEHISLEIAEKDFPDTNFSLFLKAGHAQQGIDIKSAIEEDGKFICLQCKKVKCLEISDLNEIVHLFLEKEFADKTSIFVLATTADLQIPKLQKHLRVLEKMLLDEHGIRFWQWDILSMSQKLVDHYSVVQYYFGTTMADQYCHHQIRLSCIPKRPPIESYIPRKVRLHQDRLDDGGFGYAAKWIEGIDLPNIFDGENRFRKQQVCLIGDAHQGKSVLLKQASFLLEQIDVPYVCLLIELKLQIIRPINEMLTQEFGSWKQLPSKDLIILVDGLDEVPSDKFIEAVKYIRAFSLENPRTSIVFSCRKIFFHSYRVMDILQDFDVYELDRLRDYDIREFLKKQLQHRFDRFMQFVYNSSLEFLLYEPFLLAALTVQFKSTPGKLADTKIRIFEKVISDSLKHNDSRQLRDGRNLRQRSIEFKRVIQKMAFALQLSGTNAFNEEEIQELFSMKERELMEHSSLITNHNGKWSFLNAVFQEHLAAMVLSRFSFERIVSLATVGVNKRKIKAKWIQTISSLLFLLEDMELKKKIFDFIESDNIELLLTTEHSRYSPELKVDILRRLISRLEEYHIRPMIIDEETIASFVYDVRSGIDYLIGVIRGNYSLIVKITCIRVLRRLSIPNDFRQILLPIIQNELTETQEVFYTNQLLELLATHRLGGTQLIKILTENKEMNYYHEYRDGIYQVIAAFDLADEYCEYILEGMPALVRHNAAINHVYSEFSIEQALSRIKSVHSFKLFFKSFSSKEWQEFYRYSSSRKRILEKIFSNAAIVFRRFPIIIFPIVKFLKEIEHGYIRDDYSDLDRFLETTNSGFLAVRILIDDILSNKNWQLGALVTEDSFDYIIYEFEEGGYLPTALTSIASVLNYRKKYNLSRKFHELAKAICGDTYPKPDTSWLVYQDLINKRRENDMYYIQSQSSFRKGIKRYFEAYGRRSILETDLYIDENSNLRRRNSDSVFICDLLSGWVKRKKKIRFSDAIEFVNDKNRFDIFRMEAIMGYDSGNTDDLPLLEKIVHEYYDSCIDSANFENCCLDSLDDEGNDNETFLRKESLLGRIFEKYQFATPKSQLMKMVWLDTSGIVSLAPGYINTSKKTLSQLILERLGDIDRAHFSGLILSNINLGIKSNRVLSTHLGLCKYLEIYESCDFILGLIENNDCYKIGLTNVTDVYLALGGDTRPLVGILQRMEDYNYDFQYYTEKLIDNHPEDVKVMLLRCLEKGNAEKEIISMAARRLCTLGEPKGFIYLAEYVRRNLHAPYRINGNIKVSAINTGLALEQLEDLAYLILKSDEQKGVFFESAANILVEWLYSFAEKSESDLELVTAFLFHKQRELKHRYPQHYKLLWHGLQAVENFRKVEEEAKGLDEIKEALMTSNLQE